MPAREASSEMLAKLMIGELAHRDLQPTAGNGTHPGEVAMEVDDLWVESPRGGYAIEEAGFSVRRGEILGIAGVEGSGQVELTEALAGVRSAERGTIKLGGRLLRSGDVRRFKAAGVAHIPADRRGDAVVETMSVADNLVLPIAHRPPFSRLGVLHPRAVRKHAVELIDEYDVRVPGPQTRVGALSGGNQQKVVVARECSRKPLVTVACYPTQGLDFSAMEFVWGQLRSRRAEGASVVLASVDLDELLALSDRVLVLHAGRIVGEVQADSATPEQLGMMMGGAEAK